MGRLFVDTIGPRKTIVLSMFSASIAMMLLCACDRLPVIIGYSARVGLSGELYRPASSALLADLVPSGERVIACSAYRMAFNPGWSFGPIAGAT